MRNIKADVFDVVNAKCQNSIQLAQAHDSLKVSVAVTVAQFAQLLIFEETIV